MLCTHKILYSDQLKNNEIGGTCSTYGGEERCIQRFGVGNLKERDDLIDTGIDGGVSMKMDIGEVGWGHGLYRCGSGHGHVAGSCECGNEPSGSLKCGEVLE